MRKKGLVYRVTMIFGVTIVLLQCGGELIYSKYFKSDRTEEI